jgi:hypothetical protein
MFAFLARALAKVHVPLRAVGEKCRGVDGCRIREVCLQSKYSLVPEVHSRWTVEGISYSMAGTLGPKGSFLPRPGAVRIRNHDPTSSTNRVLPIMRNPLRGSSLPMLSSSSAFTPSDIYSLDLFPLTLHGLILLDTSHLV